MPGLGGGNDAAVAVLGAGETIVNLNSSGGAGTSARSSVVCPEDFPAHRCSRICVAAEAAAPEAGRCRKRLTTSICVSRWIASAVTAAPILRVLGHRVGQARTQASMGKGTFHEAWQVRWEPEFAVRLVEASRYGHDRAGCRWCAGAKSPSARRLADLALLDDALFSDLANAIQPLVECHRAQCRRAVGCAGADRRRSAARLRLSLRKRAADRYQSGQRNSRRRSCRECSSASCQRPRTSMPTRLRSCGTGWPRLNTPSRRCRMPNILQGWR